MGPPAAKRPKPATPQPQASWKNRRPNTPLSSMISLSTMASPSPAPPMRRALWLLWPMTRGSIRHSTRSLPPQDAQLHGSQPAEYPYGNGTRQADPQGITPFPVTVYTFTDADYSEIELRILAHMSGDPGLIEAYKENEDIHRITASKVFPTLPSKRSPYPEAECQGRQLRVSSTASAPSACPRASRSHAPRHPEYIKAYSPRPIRASRSFLDNLVASARTRGYARTITSGRRRPIPELTSSQLHAALLRRARRHEFSPSRDQLPIL